jgi:hypothetical protein
MATIASREDTRSPGPEHKLKDEGASSDTPSSESTQYPGSSGTDSLTASPARTPRSRPIRSCVDNVEQMTEVKVHTAKCTDCDNRNTGDMWRCPGCTFQICKKCKDTRLTPDPDDPSKKKTLAHGSMLTPGGIGTGESVRRRLVDPTQSPAPKDVKMESPDDDESMEDTKVTGKGKAVATKKRPTKRVSRDDSSDEFVADPTSPTTNKRRRLGMAGITDSPTATSMRPSRTAAQSTPAPKYVPSSSPHSGDTSGSGKGEAMTDGSVSNLSLQQASISRTPEARDLSYAGRIQELLEQQGVNLPDRRYEQHFLERFQPVANDPLLKVPERVKRMGDKTSRLSAVEQWEQKRAEIYVSTYCQRHAGRLLTLCRGRR